MHAALQWYFSAEYQFVVKGVDAELASSIEARSGSHQLPVMITKENWCIADSTPMLGLLDSRLPVKRFYPDGLVGALSAVLEEYFDEWSARWCIHTRWMESEETAQHASAAMVAEQNVPEEMRAAVSTPNLHLLGTNTEIDRCGRPPPPPPRALFR
jgi:hypothetical protein